MTQRPPHSTAPGRSPSRTVVAPPAPRLAGDRANSSQGDLLGLTVFVSVSPSKHLIIEVLRRPVEFTLRSPIAVVDQLITRRPGVERLLQRIEGDIAAERAGHAPAHEAAREDIDDAGDVGNAAPGGVGARMRAGLRASNRRARHLPMRYETGLPSSVIRFRT